MTENLNMSQKKTTQSRYQIFSINQYKDSFTWIKEGLANIIQNLQNSKQKMYH